MLVYINYLHNRQVFLFANSLAHEKRANIVQFHLDNIYNVMLVEKPDIVVINESDTEHLHVTSFLQDVSSNNVNIDKTRIIILISDTSRISKINHQNIKYISDGSYLLYNEYFLTAPIIRNKYLLCHLNCVDFDTNKALEPIIYPVNRSIPVKLVNCTQVEHIQNLGMVDENTMLDLLSKCYAYINVNNEYIYDAMMMDKPIINLIDNPYMNITESPIDFNNLDIAYDKTKIQSKKISNLIKFLI